MSWWIGSGLLFLVSLLYLRRRILRMLFPKDYAYAVSRKFGPELRLPAPERIRRKLPQASLDALDAWLIDFSLVDAEVWRIARLGGATLLGSSEVESRLRTKFPFLRFEGLGQAAFLVSYYAWREGYDRAPEPDHPD